MSNSKERTAWSVPAGKLVSASTKLWNELGENGGRIIVRLDDDKSYRKNVSRFMQSGGITPSVHQKMARYIMGQRFFGPDDWAVEYGARFQKKQLRLVYEVPFSIELLFSTCQLCGRAVRDCHFLFLGIPDLNGSRLTVAKWAELHSPRAVTVDQVQIFFPDDPWQKDQPYIDDTVMNMGWYLTHIDPVSSSQTKIYDRILSDKYRLSTTIEEVTKDILVSKQTSEKPYMDGFAVCADRPVPSTYSGPVNVSCVGPYSTEGGLAVTYWDGGKSSVLITASRKLP